MNVHDMTASETSPCLGFYIKALPEKLLLLQGFRKWVVDHWCPITNVVLKMLLFDGRVNFSVAYISAQEFILLRSVRF